MKKLFALVMIFFMGTTCSFARTGKISKDFSTIINQSGVEKNSISVSIKKLENGKPVYGLNEKILMHAASVQKVLTLIPAIEVLGEDYNFTTSLYRRSEDTYIIKLGADPYLKTSDLKNLASNIESKARKLYIDSDVIEKKNWGEGWQWDDDMNILMPKFNSYNLDGNITAITVMPTVVGSPANIINPTKYPFVFMNSVVTGSSNQVQVNRDNSISANTLVLNGVVRKPVMVKIPTNNLKQYFNIRLSNVLIDSDIYLNENLMSGKVEKSDKHISDLTHPLSIAIDDILQNSNNLVSETVSKLAGAKAYNEIGTDLNGIKVFDEYCKKHNLDNSRIKLADASGVSKNNLVTSDFISEFLIKNKDNKILDKMAKPGTGTLVHRMLPIKDNLRAKTGSLSDISSIAGYLTTERGNDYAFCIIINDPSMSSYDMKTLEDYLIREAYLNL